MFWWIVLTQLNARTQASLSLYQRSSGRNPVCLPLFDNAAVPASSLSWKRKVKFGKPVRCSFRSVPTCFFKVQPQAQWSSVGTFGFGRFPKKLTPRTYAITPGRSGTEARILPSSSRSVSTRSGSIVTVVKRPDPVALGVWLGQGETAELGSPTRSP